MPEAIFKIIFYYGGDWGWEERKKKAFCSLNWQRDYKQWFERKA